MSTNSGRTRTLNRICWARMWAIWTLLLLSAWLATRFRFCSKDTHQPTRQWQPPSHSLYDWPVSDLLTTFPHRPVDLASVAPVILYFSAPLVNAELIISATILLSLFVVNSSPPSLVLEDVFLVLKEREVLKSLCKSILHASAAESASASNVCFIYLFFNFWLFLIVLIYAYYCAWLARLYLRAFAFVVFCL